MSPFQIRILGSGAALPTDSRKPTSQYVYVRDRHILLDCGEGTQLQFRKYKVKMQRLDIVCITHLHGDHFYGLVGLLSTMHLLGRKNELTIICPTELEAILKLQLEVGGGYLQFNLKYILLDGKTAGLVFEDKAIEIHTFPLKHRIPTQGFLIKEKPMLRSILGEKYKEDSISLAAIIPFREGKNFVSEDGKVLNYLDYTFDAPLPRSYAFVTDTIYLPELANVLKNVSAIYHEATFTSSMEDRAKKTFHSTSSQAAELAKNANTTLLLLGHFSARYETTEIHQQEADLIFPNTKCVEDGDLYSL